MPSIEIQVDEEALLASQEVIPSIDIQVNNESLLATKEGEDEIESEEGEEADDGDCENTDEELDEDDGEENPRGATALQSFAEMGCLLDLSNSQSRSGNPPDNARSAQTFSNVYRLVLSYTLERKIRCHPTLTPPCLAHVRRLHHFGSVLAAW